jgi:hypothetical protein
MDKAVPLRHGILGLKQQSAAGENTTLLVGQGKSVASASGFLTLLPISFALMDRLTSTKWHGLRLMGQR